MTFWKKPRVKGAKSKAAARCQFYWSKVVRQDQPFCQRCGKPTQNAHHVITRGTAKKTWWYDPNYGCGLCVNCHVNYAHSTDIDKQIEFRDEFLVPWLENRGLNYDMMKALARMRGGSALTEFELIQIKKGLQKQLRESA